MTALAVCEAGPPWRTTTAVRRAASAEQAADGVLSRTAGRAAAVGSSVGAAVRAACRAAARAVGTGRAGSGVAGRGSCGDGSCGGAWPVPWVWLGWPVLAPAVGPESRPEPEPGADSSADGVPGALEGEVSGVRFSGVLEGLRFLPLVSSGSGEPGSWLVG